MAAAAVVSVTMGVMKPVLEKLATLTGKEYKKLKGLRKKVAFLKKELKAMDALLENMDEADKLDPQDEDWRREIIDMSYDIEDCLDDFMHCVGKAGPGDKVGILQKASGFLRTFKDRYRIANQLDEIKTRVIQTSNRRERYEFNVSSTAPVVVDPRLSALYKDSATLVGIDTQKEELVRWAMDEAQQLKVASIVGLGGVGKTTLANEVYRQVAGQFDCKALVCVSQRPDMTKLLNDVVSEIGLHSSHASEMDVSHVINRIRNHLQDKRYLIVVDDLWAAETWNAIRCAFPENNKHSRVVVTTRSGVVARECCNNHGHVHKMEALSQEDSRKLFFNRVFGSEDACPSHLKVVSREILKKCGGLPLAIITIASILAYAPANLEREGQYIQNSLDAKSATDNDSFEDMMHILDLSYKNLPYQLKACFLYLGTYPEDHFISKVELVRRWVAEDFVRESFGRDVWDVAESYFNELVNRSMIQPIYRNIDVSGCTVHDMMLELIVRRCKEDNFLSLADGPQALAETQGQGKAIRRLTVDLRGVKYGHKMGKSSATSLSKIRSLTAMGELNWIPPMAEFRYLRVLALHSHEPHMTVDLTGIGQLRHLRYVHVELYQGDVVLPDQIRSLQRLETLELDGYVRIREGCTIPSDIFEVPRLSHLVVPWNAPLPEGIGKAKSLRTLRGFKLPDSSMLLERSIVELGELPALSDLELYAPQHGWNAALSDSFASLSPPFRSLQRLIIERCPLLSAVPSWIGHLRQLRMLSIMQERFTQEDVNMIGTRLASLVELRLRIVDLPAERIFIGASTGFTLLDFFEFSCDCDGISRLTFEAGAMPQLRLLRLNFDAGRWDRAPPQGLHHLQSLQLIDARAALHMLRHSGYRDFSKDGWKAEAAKIRGVFEEAFDALPTRPQIILDSNWSRK